MERSGVLIGGVFSVAVAIVAITVLMSPPLEMQSKVAVDEEIIKAGNETVAKINTTEQVAVDEEIIKAGMSPNSLQAASAGEAQIDMLSELSLVEVFRMSEPGVVQINVRKGISDISGIGLGSGFVYDVEGHIITNAHVVRNAEDVIITFLDGRSYIGQVIGADMDTDLAVIKSDANRTTLHPLPIGDSSRLKIGEQIAAIGNPFGLSGSMTSGIISQIGRLLPQATGFSIPDIIQTDAAINPGNSGGPLINMMGEVVGVNTAIQSATGEFTGIGFAVPSNTISKIVPVLISEGEYQHPWLGVRGADIGPEYADVLNLLDARGFLIMDVIDDSPAFKAGLQGATDTVQKDGQVYRIGGDIVLSVDGKEVRKIDDILLHLQREKAVGDTLELEVLRDGRTSSLAIMLEERPE